jgi:hypothetical protein
MTQRTHDHEWLVGNALFSCRDSNCAAETSYHASGLRLAPDNQPVCENCWDHEAQDTSWASLKEFMPFDNMRETAALIERLENDKKYLQIAHGVKLERLRQALKPFADIELSPQPQPGDWVAKTLYCNNQITAHQVQKARAALEGK